jgi:3-oxoacyl-[acyl-carrier-protein] synthase I
MSAPGGEPRPGRTDGPRGVVVTGLGAITCAGRTAAETWRSVQAGKSGIGPIRQWDASGWPCEVAGEVPDFDPRALVSDRKLHKLLGRQDLLGLKAAHEALAHSGLLAFRDGLDPAERVTFNERTAVIAASIGGAYRNQYDFLPLLAKSKGDMRVFGEELDSTVTPMWLLRTLPNNVLCYAGVTTGFKGPNSNFTSHSASGALAILEAARVLREGEADRALVIGYDASVEQQAVLYFAGLGLLSRTAIRPFDARRDGSILGEGAGALVLEVREAAERRGARVMGEVMGGAVCAEGEGLLGLREDGDGVSRALALALADAGTRAGEVSLVAAHGNGTLPSDDSEARAIVGHFGADGPPVTAFKWAVGHLLAASGLVESVLLLSALAGGVAPGIATLGQRDPAWPGLSASAEHRAIEGRTGVLIGRGFGGLASALVFRGARTSPGAAGSGS